MEQWIRIVGYMAHILFLQGKQIFMLILLLYTVLWSNFLTLVTDCCVAYSISCVIVQAIPILGAYFSFVLRCDKMKHDICNYQLHTIMIF